MKKLLSIAVLSLTIFAACNGIAPADPTTKEGAEQIAREWVEEKSPTYTYDGSNLTRTKIFPLSCENCWKYEFVFESAHGGYGDRSDQVTTEVITDHTIQVLVENGEVTDVATDGTFDELGAYNESQGASE